MKKYVALGLVSCLLAWSGQVVARIWHVPMDATTIQAGIDSASAMDHVVVACGTYYEHDICMKPGIELRSESDTYECVTINAESKGRGFYCSGLNGATVISGFTIAGGLAYDGAGIYCTLGTDMVLRNCYITDNRAVWAAGMACVLEASPTIEHCVFSNNHAERDGGGIGCSNSFAVLANCTFYRNLADETGPAVFCQNGAWPRLDFCILADNYSTTYPGPPVWCLIGCGMSFESCNIFNSEESYWIGCVDSQIGTNGNISAEPGFCSADEGDFNLCSDSWCLPRELPDGSSHGLIGALGEGCASCGPHVEGKSVSWGGVKVIYR